MRLSGPTVKIRLNLLSFFDFSSKYLFEEELLGKGKYVFFSSEISPSFYSSI